MPGNEALIRHLKTMYWLGYATRPEDVTKTPNWSLYPAFAALCVLAIGVGGFALAYVASLLGLTGPVAVTVAEVVAIVLRMVMVMTAMVIPAVFAKAVWAGDADAE